VRNSSTGTLQVFKYNGWIKAEQVILAPSEAGPSVSSIDGEPSHTDEERAADHADVKVLGVAPEAAEFTPNAAPKISESGPAVAATAADSVTYAPPTFAELAAHAGPVTVDSAKQHAHTTSIVHNDDPELAGPTSFTYEVTCHTSDLVFAGTSAPVLLKLFGPGGKQLQGAAIPLKPARGGFSRKSSALSTFQVPATADCGHPLSGVVVSLGQMVIQDQWHLETLQISCLETGHTYKFKCGQWLGDKHRKEVEWRRDPGPTPHQGGLALVDEGMAPIASQGTKSDRPVSL
jgi:hypothetical protein